MVRSQALEDRLAEHARVLIVDDSAVARAVIARMVDSSDRFVVARTCATAAAALDFLRTDTVEFILLDVQMPGTDGLTALPDLLAAGKGAKVLIVSSTAADGAVTTVQALALGAADTLVKPAAGDSTARFAEALLDKLQRLADAEIRDFDAFVVPVPIAAPPPVAPARAVQARPGNDIDIVAIGASTGGIHALSALLREIPQSCRVPILVTQHLPASFMPYFAAQLAVLAGRPCEVAVDRLRIKPGRIIVAPGDAHLRCISLGDGNAAIRLSKEPSLSGCTPSVDPMLSSVAEVYGARMMGIVLSGMGRDGADGARVARAAGASIVVQDRESSVIWGMPGAVAQAGDAMAMLPPAEIGRLIAGGRRP